MKFKDPREPEREPEPAPIPRDDLGIEATRRGGTDDRCALCHDAILLAHAGARCGACETVLHHECAKGVSTCPTLGCGVKTRSFVPLVASRGLVGRLRGESSLGRGLLAVLAVIGLLIGALLWSLVSGAELDAIRAGQARREARISQAETAKRDAWIETLRTSRNEARRRAAAQSLEAYPSAATFLAEACLDSVSTVRKAAAWSLAKNPGKLQAARILRLALGGGDVQRRLAAAEALAEARLSTPALREALAGATGDADGRVRAAAAQALWNVDAALAAPHLVRLLEDADAEVAALSQSLLSERAPLAVLVPALDAAGVRVRRGAAAALARRASLPPYVLGPLSRRLADDDAQTRASAASALGTLGSRAAPAVSELVRLLDDRWAPVRLAAIKALGAIGPSAHAARSRLRAVRDADVDSLVRDAAGEALRRVGS